MAAVGIHPSVAALAPAGSLSIKVCMAQEVKALAAMGASAEVIT